jgi:hypothetical protein
VVSTLRQAQENCELLVPRERYSTSADGLAQTGSKAARVDKREEICASKPNRGSDVQISSRFPSKGSANGGTPFDRLSERGHSLRQAQGTRRPRETHPHAPKNAPI